MRTGSASGRRAREEALRRNHARTLKGDRRTSPVELLWDLVFVFAITQVTSLVSDERSWDGLGQGLLILALIWWAWSAFVWAANAIDPGGSVFRAALLVSLIAIFIAGLSVPGAFGADATVFAVSYVLVRFIHLGTYVYVSRVGNAAWSAIVGFFAATSFGMALLVAGSFFDGEARTLLWLAAVVIDYAGPAWLTRERLAGLQSVAVAHFAERYGLFIIICLGESVVAIGVGASRSEIDFEHVAAVVLSLLIVVGFWWNYFDRVADDAEAHLRDHHDPVLAAADAYSYMHLLLVAGIVLFAVAARWSIAGLDTPLDSVVQVALFGGVAMYALGLAAFRLRMTGVLDTAKVVGAAALGVEYALIREQAAWSGLVGVALVLGAMAVAGPVRPGSPPIGRPGSPAPGASSTL